MEGNNIFESAGELMLNDGSGKEDELKEEKKTWHIPVILQSMKEVRILKNSKN